jgi:hypothetical protein
MVPLTLMNPRKTRNQKSSTAISLESEPLALFVKKATTTPTAVKKRNSSPTNTATAGKTVPTKGETALKVSPLLTERAGNLATREVGYGRNHGCAAVLACLAKL